MTQSVSEIVLKYRKIIIILYSFFPILLLLLPAGSLHAIDKNKVTFILILNYCLSFFLFVFLIRILRREQIKNSVRSPFHFIRQFNLSYTQDPPLKYLVGAEIGVFQGAHAKQILNGYLNIEKLVLVDPWVFCAYEGSYNYLDDKKFNNMYKEVKDFFETDKRVEIIRDLSVNASKQFPDEYFDFVYLDGNHQYEFVLEDLEAWYPKLKKYGVMCGDDFGHPSGCGVVKAVSEFAYKCNLLVFNEDTQFWFVKV